MPKIKTSIKNLILAAVIFSLAVFIFQDTRKARGVDCNSLSGDAERKCEDLEKKAETYQDIIDIKNKQQTTLQRQMELINAEQAQTQADLQKTHAQVLTLAQQIDLLEEKISNKEDLIRYQKAILSRLMQAYYEDYQQGVLPIVLINKDFSEILSQTDYAVQTSTRMKDVLETIKLTREELVKEQDELFKDKWDSEQLKKKLEDKTYTLQATENQKQSLLNQTQGEEAKYQDLLARVEQQKLELFNFSASSNAADVIASVKNYPKPNKKYWASTDWYFSQRDSRWGNKTIGNSDSLMKDYGCAVSSLSMVFRFYGSSIDPGKMAKQSIFYYDLIKWPGSWSPDIKLASSVAHDGVNWSTVDKEIKNGHPVIVFIKKTSGGGGHYVVIHNKDSKDYVVHDPYFGANLYLGTSKSLMGAMNPKSGTKVDQDIIYH